MSQRMGVWRFCLVLSYINKGASVSLTEVIWRRMLLLRLFHRTQKNRWEVS